MPDLLDRLKTALADRYAVQEEIGSGGMATVYLAEDLKHQLGRATSLGSLRSSRMLILIVGWLALTGVSGGSEPDYDAAAAVPRPLVTDIAEHQATRPDFACTLVVGYSQVAQWYQAGGAFESIVDDNRWQLKWTPGGVDRWSNQDDRAWDAEILSPCSERSETPDRILLSISGPFGADEEAWAEAIEGALAQLRTHYPSVESLVLVPVVGGPDHRDCVFHGRRVRASWQHAHIDNAIKIVVDRNESGDAVRGISPEVRTCDDYRDALGHLTPEGAEAVGRVIAGYYR